MSNTRPINPNTADDVDVTFLDPMDTDDDEHMSDGSQPEESRIAAYSTLPPPLETSYATITNTQPIEPNDRAEVQLMLVDPTHEEDDNYNTSVSAEQHLEDCPPLPPLPGTSRASRYQACYDILSDPSQILRHAFLGFYTGDGVHTVGSNGAINLRSTDFVWLYRFAGTYGINPLLR